MTQECGALKSCIQKDAHARTIANKEKQREPQERGGTREGDKKKPRLKKSRREKEARTERCGESKAA